MKKRTAKKRFKISGLTLVLILSIAFFILKTGKTSKAATSSEVFKERKDSIPNNPKVNIKVRKKFDDNGNLIGYDSTYSYEYVSHGGKAQKIEMDSLMKQFQPFFFQEGSTIMQDPFSDFFNNDSTQKDNFLDEHFFENQFNHNNFDFQNMFRQMDSLRTIFLQKQFPGYGQKSNNGTTKLLKNKKGFY